MKMPKKWKTTAGAILTANWPFIRQFVELKYPEYVFLADALGATGVALGLVGVAHRVDKAK